MKHPTRIIILSLALLTTCKDNTSNHDNLSGNWPIFRGNAALDGYTQVSLPDHPTLLWSFKSDAYTKSSPVVYNQVAYWSDRRGHIYGVNTAGQQVFDYAMETAVDAIPMICDSVLYIGRMDGLLTAVSLAKQDTLWSFETWGQISASPNRMNINGKETIIVGSYDNFLYCIDPENGKEINRYPSGYYLNGAVAQNNNYIVYGGCDGWVRVIDGATGLQTDSLEVAGYIPASPAIREDWCYIADYTGNIYEIKLENGKIASSKTMMDAQDENRSFVSVPALSNKMVYVVSDDRYLYALSRKEGSTVWKYLLKGNTGESSPVVCKNKLIVCTKTGIVSMHDAQTGDLLWEYDTGEQIMASPAVINGYFYILTFKGTLFCFGKNKH